MAPLLMANDPNLMALADLLAKTAVATGTLSVPLQEQVQRMNGSRMARTFQTRLVAPLATATEHRLSTHGVFADSVVGFLVLGAALSVGIFTEALADLDERYVERSRNLREQLSRRAALAVAMDFAANRVPALTKEHLLALRRHWGSPDDRRDDITNDPKTDPELGRANGESVHSPHRRPGPSA